MSEETAVTTLPQLVFLHGLESGPHGSKFHLLAGLGLGTVVAPDCEGVHDPHERLDIIEATLNGLDDLVLVGSSFGGLMALLYAVRHPDQVAGLVLCAPAVHRPDLMEVPACQAVFRCMCCTGDRTTWCRWRRCGRTARRTGCR